MIVLFFTESAQMGLYVKTRAYLAMRGIATVEDLGKFLERDTWKLILENCKHPPQVRDPANPVNMIHTSPSISKISDAPQAQGCCNYC